MRAGWRSARTFIWASAFLQRRAAEPNLQRWDRFDDHGAPNADIINAPVTVYLRNYGGRPAKIQAANFFIGDEKEDVELRSAPIVMPGALVMFRLDWHMALTLREERWRDLKLSESEREILGLQVRFSETDDTGQVERTIMMPTSEYRTHFAANAATMTLVKPETPIRTLYPPHNFPTPPMNTGGIVNTSS